MAIGSFSPWLHFHGLAAASQSLSLLILFISTQLTAAIDTPLSNLFTKVYAYKISPKYLPYSGLVTDLNFAEVNGIRNLASPAYGSFQTASFITRSRIVHSLGPHGHTHAVEFLYSFRAWQSAIALLGKCLNVHFQNKVELKCCRHVLLSILVFFLRYLFEAEAISWFLTIFFSVSLERGDF